jgi:hypothetical protein
VNEADEVITICAVTECVRLPLVPVIVSVYVPTGADVPVSTIIEVFDFDGEMGFVTNVAEDDFGKPVTARLTEPENPFRAVMDTVYTPASPATIVCDDVAESEKSAVDGLAAVAA